jgi:hypothetical protein
MDIKTAIVINFSILGFFYKDTLSLESYIFFKTASYFVLTVNYFVIFDFKRKIYE